MSGLAEFRAKYPQYDDISDAELAERLRAKYYSDMDTDAYYKRMGIEQAQPATPTDDKPGFLGDMGRGLVRSAGNAVEGLAQPIEDLPGVAVKLASSVIPVKPPFTDQLVSSAANVANAAASSSWKPLAAPVVGAIRGAGQSITGSVAARQAPGMYEGYAKEGLLGGAKSIGVTLAESAVPTLGGLAAGWLTKNPAVARAVMGATILPQTYTGIRERQRANGKEDIAAAVDGAVLSGALDILTGSGAAVASVGNRAIIETLRSGVRKAAREVAKTGAEEGATEALQTVIEQVAGGADPLTKQALMETLEAGVAGLVGGGVFGSVAEGANLRMAGKMREAVSKAPPLHTIDVPSPNGVQQVDILSVPDANGSVIARGADGVVYDIALSELEKTQPAPPKGKGKGKTAPKTLAETLQAAATEREESAEFGKNWRAAVADPSDDEAFDAVVDRYHKFYGVPVEQATQYARQSLGRARGEFPEEVKAAPAKEQPQPEDVSPPVPPAQQTQKAGATATPAPVQPETVAPTPEPAAAPPQTGVDTPEIVAPVAEKPQEPVGPQPDRMAAFNEANTRYASNDMLATAFYNGALFSEPDAYFSQYATDEEWDAYEAGIEFADQQGWGGEVAEPSTPTEAGVDIAEGVAPAPQAEAPPAAPVVLEEPTPAPEPAPTPETIDGVPVTKVAPGAARGVKETRRGSQGTQMGRPVEGAAALTEGMREQQRLTAELENAKDNREISGQEAADVLAFLRPPTNNQELRALPEDQKARWVTALGAQKDVDAYQKRMKDIPKLVLGKPNPVYQDAEAVLAGLQRRLDQSQREIVNAARERMTKHVQTRKNTKQALRNRANRTEMGVNESRETRVQLAELRAQAMERNVYGDPSPNEVFAVENAIKTKTIPQLLDWVGSTSENPLHAAVAKRLKAALSEMQGYEQKLTLKIIDDIPSEFGPKSREEMLDSRALFFDGTGSKAGSFIYFWSGAAGPALTGMTREAVLHELLHAVLVARRYVGNTYPEASRALSRASQHLDEVLAHIERVMQQRIDSKRDDELTQIEREYKAGAKLALKNADELLTWSLTNQAFKEYLSEIPYTPKETLFGRLVDAFRRVLGGKFNENSAFAEVVRISDRMFDVPFETVTRNIKRNPISVITSMAAKKSSKPDRATVKAILATDAAGFTAAMDEMAARTKMQGAKDWFERIGTSQNSWWAPKTLLVMPTSLIKEAITSARPGLGGILQDIELTENQLRGMRNSMRHAMRRRADEIRRFAKATGKDGLATMSNAMTMARVLRVDFTAHTSLAEALREDKVLEYYKARSIDQNLTEKQRTAAKGGITKRSNELATAWDAWTKLGSYKNGQELYKRIRQYYKDMYNALRTEQDSDIKEMGLDDEATERLIAAAHGDEDADALTDEDDPTEVHPGIPQKLFAKEYFPFRRFGDFVLIVRRGKKRSNYERYHFETAIERDKFMQKRARALGLTKGSDEYDATFVKQDGLEDAKKDMAKDSFMLNQMFGIIDKATITPSADSTAEKSKEKLKDKLYQTYLMTLPERALRKQFMHAELVTGHSADWQRVFNVAASQYATQLPRLAYGRKIQRLIESAYETATEGPPEEVKRLRNALNVYVPRVRETLDPEMQGDWERRINTMTFFAFMTSLASAIAQPFSLPMGAMPRMVARYGPLTTTKTLTAYTPVWTAAQAFVEKDPATGESWFRAPSIGNTNIIKNNPLRARLWKELNDTYDLFSQKHTDMALRNRPSKFHSSDTMRERGAAALESLINASGAVFSAADQITREITGMSFAEMQYHKSRAAKKSHEEAVNDAVDAAIRNTNDTIGNYTELDRPNIFRGGPLRRMVGFLRTYSLNRTTYMFRMLRDITKGSPYQTRVQAAGELSAVMTMSAAMAGVSGMFGYSAVCAMINMLLPMMFSDDENERRRREDPLAADDADYRFRFRWIPYHFGDDSTAAEIARKGAVSVFTGADFATRLSNNDLWIRDARKGDDWLGSIGYFLASNLAPQISESANIVSGAELLANGDYTKGAAKLAPAAVRGFINAYRLETEGEKTTSLRTVMDPAEFSETDLNIQRIGFTPLKLSEVRERNRKIQGWQTAMKETRTDLLKEYRKVRERPDSTQEDLNVVLEKMGKYNDAVPYVRGTRRPDPTYFIEWGDIERSVESAEKKESKSVRGVEMSRGEQSYLN